MINFLSSWVKNLALSLIVVSILEMILPNNKTKKYIKMVMGLYILFSIISPFIDNNIKFNLEDLNMNFYTQYTEETSSFNTKVNQTSMDNRLNEIYKEELEKDITQKIEEKGYEIERCKIVAHISENDSGIENINLKINKKIIDSNEQESSNTVESRIVTEIQKIQKVKIDVSDNEQNDGNTTNQENTTNITKTDIKIIKDFLMKEYGVSEQCLRIS